jgi:DNA-binding LytR/AlgR family response regulator
MLKPFFVWQNKVLKSVNPADVVCLSTEGNYTRIFLSDKSYYMVRSTLSGTLRKLPPEMFIKIHRSFAVSIYFIDTIDRDHLTVGNDAIPIARQYYRQVIKQLNVIE